MRSREGNEEGLEKKERKAGGRKVKEEEELGKERRRCGGKNK